MSSTVNFNPMDSSAIDNVRDIKFLSLNQSEDIESETTPELTNNQPKQQTQTQSEDAQAREAILKLLVKPKLKADMDHQSKLISKIIGKSDSETDVGDLQVQFLQSFGIGFSSGTVNASGSSRASAPGSTEYVFQRSSATFRVRRTFLLV